MTTGTEVARASSSTRVRMWDRFYRPVAVGLTVAFVLYGLFVLWILATDPQFAALWDVDRGIYVGATHRWLDGRGFYYPYQVAGPYELRTGDVLYPPLALWFFVPASLVPVIGWRLIPLAVVLVVVWHHRPRPWAWPLIAACLGFQWSVMLLVTANPTLWLSAAVALGTLWAWPAIAVLAKPTLFPFALIGARRRAWWIALAVLIALSLPFGAMWVDWLHAVTNATGWRVGVLYSLGDVPWLLAPVIAWVASNRTRGIRPAVATVSVGGQSELTK